MTAPKGGESDLQGAAIPAAPANCTKGGTMDKKKYQCPECGELCSETKGCVCRDCAAILTREAHCETFGEDEAAYLEAAGLDDIGAQ